MNATCKCLRCGERKPTCCDEQTIEVGPDEYQSIDGTCHECCDCPGALADRRGRDAIAVQAIGGVAADLYWATGMQYASVLGWYSEALTDACQIDDEEASVQSC